MLTIDTRTIAAPADRVFRAAAEVERWPELLSHYRYVRFESRRADGGVVAMSADRPFGPLRWPTWWTSEMWIEPEAGRVRYRHIRGVTTGMDVVWELTPVPSGTAVVLTHRWDGPRWGPLRRPAAEWVIGPVFVHGIAARTLAGLARHLEQRND
jgi:ribosome-associated toxin RatA of RatAB toxin-antitoxin module